MFPILHKISEFEKDMVVDYNYHVTNFECLMCEPWGQNVQFSTVHLS